jgi:nitrogen regulatory protein P-II 1
MRKVAATLSPLHLEQIKDRLRMIGVPGLTVENVLATGEVMTTHEPDREVIYRGVSHTSALSPCVHMEIVVPDNMVESVINAITLIVRRAEPMSGRITVALIDEAFRIRTGEWGEDAL